MHHLGVGGAADHMPALTPREVDVLGLASHGLTSSEIAEELFVSTLTVQTHIKNIYAKLGVGNKAAAVAVALRHGLIN
jgi:DNA-binding NarL/FixJ family response regulator